MAKKKIVSNYRPREKVGIMKSKKEFVPVNFRLSIEDNENLCNIVSHMNSNTLQKTINKTDAIKALIQHGTTVKVSLLIKALGDRM